MKRAALVVGRLTKPGRYAVGDGTYLQVSKGGVRSWLFRYALAGRQRCMGLGPVALVSLAEAREKGREARKLLLDGIDPLEERVTRRRQAALEAATCLTFRECAERFIASNEAGWRNAAHRKQWPASLASYVYPVFGDLPVAAIDTALVTKALEPIWAVKPETAGRVRGRIETVLDWAKAREYRNGENPARWRGHLDKLLPARRKLQRVIHHPALPYVELPAFMAQLRTRNTIPARALEFTILTAGRTSEILGARWDEIDLSDSCCWTVPADRMKAGRAHRVPLSERAAEILESLPRGSEFVFPGQRGGKPLSTMAMWLVLRHLGRDDVTVHGFRSTFSDWCAETTGYPREIAETALAHAVESKVESAYRRGDLFEKRRRLMGDWGAFCSYPPAARGKVLPLRATP